MSASFMAIYAGPLMVTISSEPKLIRPVKPERIGGFTAHRKSTTMPSGLAATISGGEVVGSMRVGHELPVAHDTTVYVTTVGTPIGPDKRTGTEAICVGAASIASRPRPGDPVVLRSTVRVGVTHEAGA